MFVEGETELRSRCPFCGSLGEEMEYDCDFSFSEVKRFVCRRCGRGFEVTLTVDHRSQHKV
ncbi:MAG: hypothetical protein QXE16_04060 [Candidatus Bathyarchaeia archaeon]